jgi:hypothetical protein
MATIVFTYWEVSQTTGRKTQYIDHGYNEDTDKIVILPPEPVSTCDYIKWDKEAQCYLMK